MTRRVINIAAFIAVALMLSGVASAGAGILGLSVGKMIEQHSASGSFIAIEYDVVNGNENNETANYTFSIVSDKGISGKLTIVTYGLNDTASDNMVVPLSGDYSNNFTVAAQKRMAFVFGIRTDVPISNYKVSFNMPGFTYEDSFTASLYDENLNGRIERVEASKAVVDYFRERGITRQEAIDVVAAYFATQPSTPVESLSTPIVRIVDSRIVNINTSDVNEFAGLVRGSLINFKVSIKNIGSDNIAIESMVIAKNTIDGNIISVPRVYGYETFGTNKEITTGSSWYTNTGVAVDSVVAFNPPFTVKTGQTVNFTVELDTLNTDPVSGSSVQFTLTRMAWIVFSTDGTQPSVENNGLFNQRGEELIFIRI